MPEQLTLLSLVPPARTFQRISGRLHAYRISRQARGRRTTLPGTRQQHGRTCDALDRGAYRMGGSAKKARRRGRAPAHAGKVNLEIIMTKTRASVKWYPRLFMAEA